MIIVEVAAEVLSLVALVCTFLALLLLVHEHPDAVVSAGLDQHEAAFVAVAGFAGVLFSVPVFLAGTSLLAVNVGGALVPLAITAYLLVRVLGWEGSLVYCGLGAGFAIMFTYDVSYEVGLAGSLPFSSMVYSVVAVVAAYAVMVHARSRAAAARTAFALFGLTIVAYLAFYSTRFDPALGVVSGFPNFLIPMVVPASLAIPAFWDDPKSASAIAYASGAMGVMVGADIVRIPALISSGGLVGAIGGAGALDLIYLAGTASFMFVVAYAVTLRGRMPWTLPPYRYHLGETRRKFRDALLAFREERFAESVECALDAVEHRILALQTAMGSKGDTLQAVYAMQIPYATKYDMWLLRTMQGRRDRGSALRSVMTAAHLVRTMNLYEYRERRVAPLTSRALAVGVDILISLLLLVPLGLHVLSLYSFSMGEILGDIYAPVPLAYILLVTSFFIVYSFVFEAVWGRTPGKYILGLVVLRDDGSRLGAFDALIRNVVRAVDFLPALYIFGGLAALSNPARQRLGDMLGRTIVVRTG